MAAVSYIGFGLFIVDNLLKKRIILAFGRFYAQKVINIKPVNKHKKTKVRKSYQQNAEFATNSL